MNKLLKRTLMVGALAGCLATAAWAGNVEVDPQEFCPSEEEFYFPEATTIADGYYLSGYKGDGYGSQIQTGFDAEGRLAWSVAKEDYATITVKINYEDDKIETVTATNIVDEEMGVRSSRVIETIAYDDQGRVTKHSDVEVDNTGSSERAAIYTYGDHEVKITETFEGEEVAEYTYTTNDKNQVVKLAKKTYNSETKAMEETIVHEFTYDDNGNLVKDATSGKFGGRVAEYEYNKDGLCVKRTDADKQGMEYTYDENGNAVTIVTINSAEEKQTEACTYAAIPEAGSKSDFTDVKTEEYYAAPVLWATATGITDGMGNNQFCPDSACTRAQLATFLWRAAGKPEPKTTTSPFTDVQDTSAYYYKAVLWAAENNITKGVGDNKFDPDATCTRAQIVTLIYRAAGEPKVTATNPFSDVVENDYYDAILWAVNNGVTKGMGDGKFGPDMTCTRGQGVTFLYRGIGLY